ncbi:MAG: sulfite exporter TauE/SafE family protein [Bacteriovoracaceae bacterium]
MNITFYNFIFIGLITGIFSGLFGIGGGLIMIPILLFYCKIPQVTASGVSLVAMLLPVGALGVWQYYRSGLINGENIRWGIFIAIGIFFGTFLGAKIAPLLPVKWLSRMFSILMLVGAYRVWLQSLKK